MSDPVGDALSRMRGTRPDVYALAMLASLSPRITPDFLRDLRLELGAEAYDWTLQQSKSTTGKAPEHPPDADSEAALWFSPLLVRGRGPEGIALQPDVTQRLQVALKRSKILPQAAGMLDRHRTSLPRELDWQARLSMHLLEGHDGEVEVLEEELLAALQDPEDQRLRSAVADWLLREVHPALPELRRFPGALVSEIAAGALAHLPQPLLEGASASELAELHQYDLTGLIRTTPIMLRRLGGELWMSDNLDAPTHTLEVPDTNPIVLAFETRAHGAQREGMLRFFRGGEAAREEVGVGSVELRDIFGRTFRLDERPASPRQPPRPGERGDLHSLIPSVGPLVGRERELADLRTWLAGTEAVRVLVGPPGRGKQRLSEELAREFSGLRFVGHVRDTDGLPLLLLRLAEFLGVAGPRALPEALASPRGPTLIVLQGLSVDDFQNQDLTAFTAALDSQAVVKLLLTSVSAPTDLPSQAIATLDVAAADAGLVDSVASPEVRRRLTDAGGGEPLLLLLLRAAARELGAEAAEAIASSFGLSDDTAMKVRRVVDALMERSPGRYMDIIGDLALASPVAAALSELYQPIVSPDNDINPLVVWCNDSRDHAVRQATLAAIDESGTLPSRNLVALLERLSVWTPTDVMVGKWPFWPAVANTLARVLARRDDATSSILEDLLRRDISRWRPEQVLQIALPKSGLIATGDPLATELARRLWSLSTERRKAHRQGAWTLTKDIASAAEAREALARFEALDYWARTRLIISLVQLPPAEKEALRDPSYQALLEPARQFFLAPVNGHFTALLLLWATHPKHTRFDLATVFDLPPEATQEGRVAEQLGLPRNHAFLQDPELVAPPVADDDRMRAVTHDVLARYIQGLLSDGELRVFADFVALQIEVGRDKSDRPLRRYDVFEAFTTEALKAAGGRILDLVRILAMCLDEGMRWGVAQRFKPAHTKTAAAGRGEQEMPSLYQLAGAENYWDAARIMAADENEWVIRDTLAGVAALWPSILRDATDAAGAAGLAQPARDWMDANFHRGDDQLFDVRSNIDRLRAVCPPFAVRWEELEEAGGGVSA